MKKFINKIKAYIKMLAYTLEIMFICTRIALTNNRGEGFIDSVMFSYPSQHDRKCTR